MLVGGADPGDQLRAGPERGHAGAGARRDRARGAGRASTSASGGRRTRSTTSRSPRGRTFWVAACAGIIVFGSLMGAMFIGQQFLQNVLGYSTLEAGAAILPAAFCMVLVAPRSAKIVEARGARFTLLLGYVFCLLGFLTMLLLWKEGIPYWKVGLGYAFVGIGVGLRRHAGLALAHRLGAGARARAWRRAPPTCSATSAARSCSRSSARCSPPATPRRWPPRSRSSGKHVTRQRSQSQLTKSFAGAADIAQAVPAVREPDHGRGEDVVPPGRPVGLHRRDRRGPARRGARLLRVPEARAARSELLARYHAEDA